MKQVISLQAAGDYAQARRIAGDQLAKEETADWLRVAGELDEKLGDPVAAVNKLERAAHEDGSEENYFAWGSELLLHRAIWQAKDVFVAGAERYPTSARMLTALGAALFACSLYDDAAQRLCEAADLEPDSAEPYVFLGKAEFASPNSLGCSEGKLAEFAKRMPENPLASYFYAIALWKHSGRSADPEVLEKVEALLKRALALDPKCSDAYLQLGNLNAARRENTAAIANYQMAIKSNPDVAEAHYRLGLAYDRAGEKEQAAREFAIHEKLDKEQAAEVERERREVKQFLVQRIGAGSTSP
jgi:tetratricopeptide (TPR) repeat protein